MNSSGEDERSARSAGSESRSLLSHYSNTTYNDSDEDDLNSAIQTFGPGDSPKDQGKQWKYTFYRTEGNLHIIGEWTYKSEAYRIFVIGPDITYATATFTIILGPSIIAYLLLLETTWAIVVYSVLFGACMMSFLILFMSDPGLLRSIIMRATRSGLIVISALVSGQTDVCTAVHARLV